jgi:potassium/chloride transporter 9
MDSESDSLHSSNGQDDDADDEAVASESEAAISGSNFDEYDLDASSDESSNGRRERPGKPSRAKTSLAGTGTPFFSRKLDLRKSMWKGSQGSPRSGLIDPTRPAVESVTSLRPHAGTTASDTTIASAGRRTKKAHSVVSSSSQLSSSSRARALTHPSVMDEHSSPKFTSNRTPRTAIAHEEASGPPIMFVDTPSPTLKKKDPFAEAAMSSEQLAATTSQPASSQVSAPNSPMSPGTGIPSATPYISSPASGFPAQQAIPLSFNDLPCRAQHLILNELIRQHSDGTAVVRK